ncbi:hypothetical protein SCHPADRAFT_884522 [Schizopora paradoxa]|uniref:Uncharacterized protein n=1 Tax=Schizopora paradoxa TaxID=27342 RepID=A0A0H2SFB9_9AGAM|nr:hypothetical protein SCHPADRAFT_884522 [Schizopora paradoxa]
MNRAAVDIILCAKCVSRSEGCFISCYNDGGLGPMQAATSDDLKLISRQSVERLPVIQVTPSNQRPTPETEWYHDEQFPGSKGAQRKTVGTCNVDMVVLRILRCEYRLPVFQDPKSNFNKYNDIRTWPDCCVALEKEIVRFRGRRRSGTALKVRKAYAYDCLLFLLSELASTTVAVIRQDLMYNLTDHVVGKGDREICGRSGISLRQPLYLSRDEDEDICFRHGVRMREGEEGMIVKIKSMNRAVGDKMACTKRELEGKVYVTVIRDNSSKRATRALVLQYCSITSLCTNEFDDDLEHGSVC